MPLLRHVPTGVRIPARGGASLLAALLVLLPMASAVHAADPVIFRVGIRQVATATATNPFLATAGQDWLMITDMYDLLTEFGPDLKPAPGLAYSWETSADGLTWTYHIREAKWQDGQPVTADDVAFTFNFIRNSENPAYKGPQAPNGNDKNGDGSADNPISRYDNYLDLDRGFDKTRITSVQATDPRTVVIRTTAPIITLNQVYIPIVPKHQWETVTYQQVTDKYKPKNPIGSGPFILKEFHADQFMRFDAFREYWGGAPKIDQLIYQYFSNEQASIAALQNNNPQNGVDMLADVPATLVDAIKSDSRITIYTGISSDFIELGFNSWNPDAARLKKEGCKDCPKGPTTGSLGNPWLTKPQVRAALAQLIDKQNLVARAKNGYGAPGKSIVGPYNAFYSYDPPADNPATYPGSPEAAKARFLAVMNGLGFSDTDHNGILNVPNTPEAQAFDPKGAGKDWSLRLFVRNDHEDDKTAADLIKTTFEGAGVSVDKQAVKEDVLYTATYPNQSNADMDMYIWGFGPDPDPDFILSIFACNQINGWGDANYCDPAYDQMYAASRTQTDLNARAALVKQLQEKVYTDSPYSVLWYSGTIEAYRSDRWQGFNPLPKVDGSLWGAWGFGPYASRLTLAPVGAVQASPSSAPSGTTGPVASPGPQTSAAPVGSGSGAAASAGPPTLTPAASIGTAPTSMPTLAPGAGGTSGAATGSDSTPMILGLGVVALIGAAVLLAMRRRAGRDDE